MSDFGPVCSEDEEPPLYCAQDPFLVESAPPPEQLACEQPTGPQDLAALLAAFGHFADDGESRLDLPSWLEGLTPFFDAKALADAADAAKKAQTAGDPTKESPEAKAPALKPIAEKGDASLKGGLGPDGTAMGTGAIKNTEIDAEAKQKVTVDGSATAKVTAKGVEGSGSIGVKKEQIDEKAEEAREQAEIRERNDFERKKANGNLPPDAEFKPTDAAKAKPAPGSATSAKGSVSVDDKGASASTGVDHTVTRADGSTTGVGGSGKLAVGPDGSVSGGVSAELKRTDADGKKQLGGSGSVDIDKDGVTVKGGLEHEKGSLSAELIKKDGEDGLRGGGSAKVGQREFSLSGGRVVKFLAPVELPNKRWSVTYAITTDISGKAGAATDEKHTPTKGATNLSGSVNASFTDRLSVTKTFATEEEALAFRKAESVGDVALPTSAAQAENLKPGEKVVAGESLTRGVDGSIGHTYFGTLGAGGSKMDGNQTSVEMQENNVVHAERTATTDDTGKLSYTAPTGALGISGANSDTTLVRTKIRVNLGSAESPDEAGRAAYETFMATGDVVTPATVVSTTTMAGKKKTREVQLGPLKTFENSEVTDGVTHDEQGTLEHTSGERTRGWELKALGMGGSYGTRLDALQREYKDTDPSAERTIRAYVVSQTVKQTSAYDSIMKLDNAAGGNIRSEKELAGLKASGTWEMQSVLSPESVDNFVKQVNSGNYKTNFVHDEAGKIERSTNTFFPAGDELKRALAEAGDNQDAQRKAIATFVAEGGERAVDQMRALGGADKEFYASLTDDAGKPDPNFRGIQGRMEMESGIASLQARCDAVGGDPQLLLADVKALSVRARSRMYAITPERYPDLPPDLMAKEVARSQQDVERLEALAAPLRNRVNDARLAKLSPQERAARTKQTELGVELEGIGESMGDGMIGSAKTDPGMRRAVRMKAMAAAHSEADAARASARKTKRIHTGDTWDYRAGRPRDRISSDDEMAGHYQRADGDVAAGHIQYEQAVHNEIAAYAMPETDDAQIEGSIGMVEAAITCFQLAIGSFKSGTTGYDAIATANPDEIR